MKTFKFFAFVLAFALSLTVSLATQSDGSDTQGVPSGNCNAVDSFIGGTCWSNGHGSQCTLVSSGLPGTDKNNCGVQMTINP